MSRAIASPDNRSTKGSSIAEFGPALLILFIFLFFPLLDLLTMPMHYMSCATLNDLQLREAVNVKKSEAESSSGAVKSQIPHDWQTLGVGQFVGVVTTPDTDVKYIDGEGEDKIVIVTTSITCRPFLTLPWFFPIPGLTVPSTYSITSRRILENQHNFDS